MYNVGISHIPFRKPGPRTARTKACITVRGNTTLGHSNGMWHRSTLCMCDWSSSRLPTECFSGGGVRLVEVLRSRRNDCGVDTRTHACRNMKMCCTCTTVTSNSRYMTSRDSLCLGEVCGIYTPYCSTHYMALAHDVYRAAAPMHTPRAHIPTGKLLFTSAAILFPKKAPGRSPARHSVARAVHVHGYYPWISTTTHMRVEVP